MFFLKLLWDVACHDAKANQNSVDFFKDFVPICGEIYL